MSKNIDIDKTSELSEEHLRKVEWLNGLSKHMASKRKKGIICSYKVGMNSDCNTEDQLNKDLLLAQKEQEQIDKTNITNSVGAYNGANNTTGSIVKRTILTISASLVTIIVFFIIILIVAPIINSLYVWCVKNIVPARYGGGSGSLVDYEIINIAFRDVLSSVASSSCAFYAAIKLFNSANFNIVWKIFVAILTIFYSLRLYSAYINAHIVMSLIEAITIYLPSVIMAILMSKEHIDKNQY